MTVQWKVAHLFLLIGTLVAPVATTLGQGLSTSAQTFSDASLKGSYSFLNNVSTADASTTEFATLGMMSFDGKGNLTGSAIVKQGASSSEVGVAFGGTYTVNRNGTGAITLTYGNPSQFAIVLHSFSGGIAHGFQLLKTDDGHNEIVSGTAVLQSTTAQRYSVASLEGSFATQEIRWSGDVTVTQAGAISVVTFDGKGHGTGSITYVLGATPYVNITINCVYSVATNGIGSYTCSSSISPDPLTYAFVLNSISGQRAGGFQFLLTDPLFSANFVQTGFAIKQ